MNIEKYDWLKDIYNQINFNNLPHGIIINGPSGVGKKILSKQISKKILSNFEDSDYKTSLIKMIDYVVERKI